MLLDDSVRVISTTALTGGNGRYRKPSTTVMGGAAAIRQTKGTRFDMQALTMSVLMDDDPIRRGTAQVAYPPNAIPVTADALAHAAGAAHAKRQARPHLALAQLRGFFRPFGNIRPTCHLAMWGVASGLREYLKFVRTVSTRLRWNVAVAFG